MALLQLLSSTWADPSFEALLPSSAKENPMSELVVIAFPTESKAEEVRQKLLAIQKEYLIELGDAVVAVKDADGRIKLNQLLSTPAIGAVSGAFWGSLIGLLFLMPLAGAALGASSVAIGVRCPMLDSLTTGR